MEPLQCFFELFYYGLSVFVLYLISQWNYFNCQLSPKIQIIKLQLTDGSKMCRAGAALVIHMTIICGGKTKEGGICFRVPISHQQSMVLNEDGLIWAHLGCESWSWPVSEDPFTTRRLFTHLKLIKFRLKFTWGRGNMRPGELWASHSHAVLRWVPAQGSHVGYLQ